MRVNKLSDSVQATRGEAGSLRWGALMCRTNIDELPQFFEVWGTMSTSAHAAAYRTVFRINQQLSGTSFAKPGLWLAQVNGFRGETKELIEMKDRVDFDIWYNRKLESSYWILKSFTSHRL
jgi:undecaprenyl-phosphate galactose phosphotransferase/putative colanic acid biosynthesis UDP-glucose lipid carrier transferase